MYTGIVQTVAPVTRLSRHEGHVSLTLDLPQARVADLQVGGSVAVEGVCLSATAIEGTEVSFDAMTATLERTNLGRLEPGGRANVERSMRMDEENGGHVVAGHVSCTAELVAVKTDGAGAHLAFRVPAPWSGYIFERGFLAVNGCSLTVAEAAGDVFTIYLIPETLRQTTFPDYRVGDAVNIEVDHQTKVTVDVLERTLERLLPRYLSRA
ncbi:riboflavin synthase subunit alpha [Mangrovicoccus algicola]|uniref:Riboflavin synthase n=1 Tax=Mangrovicoccus algicola TaxID=2771008 RepID=A0A8J7D021_9RHOB|nr:riboflavin synthase subunit alpha [Mangrovicoccus algicola]MBE3638818.1 riboflavin synthase subunit alpha [Mangrovicoccus algicola]